MAKEDEFLPFLSNWMLLFVVVGILMTYSYNNFIVPKLAELEKRKSAAQKAQ